MKLYPPFIITSRLDPGLRLGDAVLNLFDVQPTHEDRDRATFILDFADGTSYTDTELRSGAGGYKGQVEIFEGFLSFLLAAVESFDYEQRTGKPGEGTDLFPRHVVEWASDNKSEIETAYLDLRDEAGVLNEALIEE